MEHSKCYVWKHYLLPFGHGGPIKLWLPKGHLLSYRIHDCIKMEFLEQPLASPGSAYYNTEQLLNHFSNNHNFNCKNSDLKKMQSCNLFASRLMLRSYLELQDPWTQLKECNTSPDHYVSPNSLEFTDLVALSFLWLVILSCMYRWFLDVDQILKLYKFYKI